MDIQSTYSVKIKYYNHIFKDTVRLYRDAVDFFIRVCADHWEEIHSIEGGIKARLPFIEGLTHRTKENPAPAYDFDRKFYKFPSYLRRVAIAAAVGKVSSWKSNTATWEKAGPHTRGQAPGFPRAGFSYPCMYRGVCYKRTGEYTGQLKVFVRNTWDWITVSLRKTDVDYIRRRCASRKECAPVLQKRGKCWYLDFCFKEKSVLSDTGIFNQRIIAVDLGINSACACSAMLSDGTVIGRHFLKLPEEYDCLKRAAGRVRKAQRHGSRDVHGLWKIVDGINHGISVKTAQFIIDTAVLYNADCIVMEHLDTSGKKRGRRRMRLHLWKAQEVQRIVTDKAHRLGMHISRICAWGTSRLAFDGSGRVLRGKESSKTGGSYSLCEFKGGKVYNCDLNASYNIGARYFVREIIKSLPATEGQRVLAKVPGCAKRSTCTLSTLISLNSALYM